MNERTDTSQRWRFHSERDSLIAEAHARPAENITVPTEVLHLAFRAKPEVCQKFFDVLGEGSIDENTRHVTGRVEGIRMKLERHTEFMSCTLFRNNAKKPGLPDPATLLHEKFPTGEIEVLVLLCIDLVKTAREMLRELPSDMRVFGGKIRSGIDVRSTFKPDDDGIVQFTVHATNLTADELGRRIQRLLEMETYRTMCLLGLPKARDIGARITKIEQQLDILTASLGREKDAGALDDEALFDQISSLSEQNNILANETRYRFAASRAYFALFQQRIDSLEEEKVGDVQTMSGFLRSRLEPAMATIESTAKRQKSLTNDLSRALLLLRTRIELNLNKGNQALLKSMDRRHDQQLKISRTVEGLSVVAITYYAVGLFSYLLKAIAKYEWMPFSGTVLTALSVPFILIAVWFSLHRIRMAWEDHGARK